MDDIRFRTAPKPKTASVTSSKKQVDATQVASVPKQQQKVSTTSSRAHTSRQPRYSHQKISSYTPTTRSIQNDRKKGGAKKAVRSFFVVLGVCSLIIVIVWGLFTYLSSNNNEISKATDETNNSESLALAIKSEAMKHFDEVPKEVPKLETVDNPSVTGDGARFKDVAKGDKVLIFPSAGKAIVYRPSTGKFVAFTTIDTDETSSSPSQNTSKSTDNPSDTSSVEGTSTEEEGGSPLLP